MHAAIICDSKIVTAVTQKAAVVLNGFGVAIVVRTALPVLSVPPHACRLGGQEALLSIVPMPQQNIPAFRTEIKAEFAAGHAQGVDL